MTAKKQSLPGLERKNIAEVSEAAGKYQEAKLKRVKLTNTEVDLKDKLVMVMHKHNLLMYRDDELIVEIVPGKEKIKVKEADEDDPE